MEQNKTGQYFKYAIGEIILVVIGILIALGINNWNESRKANKAQEQILTSIKKEIEANKKHIEKVFPYHKMIRDTVRTINFEALKTSNENPLRFWKGHRIFRLRTASFQTAVQSGIMKDINLELSESLNNLYTSVEFYNDFSKTVSNGIFSINQTSDEGALQMLSFVRMIMEDVYYSESELLNGFEDNLEEIDAELNF